MINDIGFGTNNIQLGIPHPSGHMHMVKSECCNAPVQVKMNDGIPGKLYCSKCNNDINKNG